VTAHSRSPSAADAHSHVELRAIRSCIFMRWLECHLRWRRLSIQPRRCYSGRAERRIGTQSHAQRLDDHRTQISQLWSWPLPETDFS
jgi:hypothetical protein